MAAAALAVAASTICDLLLPTIMSEILNNGVYHSDFAYIAASCGRMLLVAAAGFGLVIRGNWLSCQVMADFCADLRGFMFRKVNQMSFAEYGELGTAALVTRVTADVENASWIPSMLSGPIITIPALFLGGGAGHGEGCFAFSCDAGLCAGGAGLYPAGGQENPSPLGRI